MPTGIPPVLPVGPDGLPVDLTGGGGGGGGGTGTANVNVVTQSASTVKQLTLDLATARAAVLLDTSGLKIYSVTVRKLSGAGAPSVRLHLGGATAQGLEVAEGELRDGLTLNAIALTNDTAGGSLQLEIFGG